jgi:hypothetical protein
VTDLIMSNKRVKYWVSPEGDDWRVQREGADRASGVFEDKTDAIARAKELAKAQPLGQIIIQRGDGQIQTEHTYGKDPERFPG